MENKYTAKVRVIKKDPRDYERRYKGEDGDPERLTETEVKQAIFGHVKRITTALDMMTGSPGRWYGLSNFAEYRYNPEEGSDDS